MNETSYQHQGDTELRGVLSGSAGVHPDLVSRTLRQLSTSAVDTGTQLILRLMYRDAVARGDIPSFADVGFSNFSQTEEDGILWFLLSVVGADTRRVIELGAGDGAECNTANLVLNHQFSALLVDGNRSNVENGRSFLATRSVSRLVPPAFVQSWITRENVNDLVSHNGFAGPVDVLSIDIDGNDYWVWQALTVVDPAIVVMEFNPCLTDGPALTVPYAADFTATWIELTDLPPMPGGDRRPLVAYQGASLRAMVTLGRTKGYRFVGMNALGFNAFFVRNDLAVDILPEVDVSDCFRGRSTVFERGREAVLQYPWVEV